MTGKGAGGEAASWRPPASEKEEAMPRGVGKGVTAAQNGEKGRVVRAGRHGARSQQCRLSRSGAHVTSTSAISGEE